MGKEEVECGDVRQSTEKIKQAANIENYSANVKAEFCRYNHCLAWVNVC